jgi:hypothetical protein
MLKFFRSIYPVNLLGIVLLGLLLALPWWWKCAADFTPFKSLFIQIFNNAYSHLPMWLNWFLAAALQIGTALYLNHVSNKHEILYKQSYLPAFFYLVISGFSNSVLGPQPLLVANFLLIAVFNKMMSAFKEQDATAQLFDGGLLIGLVVLLYAPLMSAVVFYIGAIIIIRSFKWKEMLIATTAIGIPIFLTGVGYYCMDSFPTFLSYFTSMEINKKLFYNFEVTKAIQLYGLLMAIITLAAAIKMRLNYYKNAIKTRLCQQLLTLYIITMAGSLLLVDTINWFQWLVMATPVSLFWAYYFLSGHKRLWIKELLVLMLLVFTIYLKITTY